MDSLLCKTRRMLGVVACLATASILSCGRTPSESADPVWVATIPPLAEMVQAIAGDEAHVVTLLPPGASPHSYAPKPSDVAQAESASAVFFVAPNLDGWIVRYADLARVSVFTFIDESLRLKMDHDHGSDSDWDPHFWMDPTLMMAIAPQVAAVMAERDSEHAETYRARATEYMRRLETLDGDIAATLAPIRGRSVLLVHPSLSYFLRRYDIPVAGYVEPIQGRKPSPMDLKELIEVAQQQQVRAVFSETQLPRQSVAAIAESLNLPLFELDPLGGVEGRMDYESLVRFNAQVLLEALQ